MPENQTAILREIQGLLAGLHADDHTPWLTEEAILELERQVRGLLHKAQHYEESPHG